MPEETRAEGRARLALPARPHRRARRRTHRAPPIRRARPRARIRRYRRDRAGSCAAASRARPSRRRVEPRRCGKRCGKRVPVRLLLAAPPHQQIAVAVERGTAAFLDAPGARCTFSPPPRSSSACQASMATMRWRAKLSTSRPDAEVVEAFLGERGRQRAQAGLSPMATVRMQAPNTSHSGGSVSAASCRPGRAVRRRPVRHRPGWRRARCRLMGRSGGACAMRASRSATMAA